MGVNWSYVRQMEERGFLRDGRVRVLDVGSSNLYEAEAGEIERFVRKYNTDPGPGLPEYAARAARGSAYDPVRGGLNETFLGDVLERAGIGYDSIDIAAGHKTTIVDLNVHRLPAPFVGAFDLVLNFGTTEHILNQMNSFRAIHDAAKVGAHIWHQLPAVGYLDHGYFCYTGRFFFDLAGYNRYELAEAWFEGPGGPENVFQSVRSYRDWSPVLAALLARIGVDARESALDRAPVPTVSLNVIYRKVVDQPFMGATETSTSVGTIHLGAADASVMAQTAGNAPARRHWLWPFGQRKPG
jgi:hypothetical protein